MKKTILIVLFSILTAFFGFFAVAGQITVDVTRTREITVEVVEDDTSVDEDNTATEAEEQVEEQGTEAEEQGTEQGTEVEEQGTEQGAEEQGTEQGTEGGEEQGTEQNNIVASSYKLVEEQVTGSEDEPVVEEVTTETYTTPFNDILYGWSDTLVNHKEIVNITCAFLFAICAVVLTFIIFNFKFEKKEKAPKAKKEKVKKEKAEKAKKVEKTDKQNDKKKQGAGAEDQTQTGNRPNRPKIKF